MSLRVTADQQAFYIYEGLGHTVPAMNVAWTLLGDFVYHTDPNIGSIAFTRYIDAGPTGWAGAYMMPDGSGLFLSLNSGTVAVDSAAITLVPGTHYPMSLHYNGAGVTTLKIDGVLTLRVEAVTLPAGTAGQRSIQWGGFGTPVRPGYMDSSWARWRFWSGVSLSDAECRAEHRSATPVRTANLVSNWPMEVGANRFEDTVGPSDLLENPSFPLTDGDPIPLLTSLWAARAAEGTSASGTTTCAPSYPAGTINPATSALFCLVTGRSNTAGTAPTMPAGWSVVADLEGGVGTWGVDTGTRRITLFRKDTVAGTESGTVTIGLAGNTNNTLRATIFRVERSAGTELEVAATTGADTSHGTDFWATGASPLAVAPGDAFMVGVAQNIDTGLPNSLAVALGSVAFGLRDDVRSDAVTNGHDHRHILRSFAPASGSDNATPIVAYTSPVAVSGAALFARFRALPPPTDGKLQVVAITTAPPESPTSTDTKTVLAPAGVQAGYRELILCAVGAVSPAPAPVIEELAGWEMQQSDGSHTMGEGLFNLRMAVFTRVADGPAVDSAITSTTPGYWGWHRLALRNANDDFIAKVIFGEVSPTSATPTLTGFTPEKTNALRIDWHALGALATISPATGMTELSENVDHALGLYSQQLDDLTPTGTRTYGYTPAADAGYITLELHSLASASEGVTAVGADLDTAYTINSIVGASLDTAYGLAGHVGADLNTAYAILGAIGADLSTAYGVNAIVGSNLDTAYGISAIIGADLDTDYSVQAFVSADLETAYSILTSVGADLSTAYGVMESVGASLDTAYSVEGALAVVGADLDTAYGVNAIVGASLDTAYGVAEFVGADLDTAYGVAGSVGSSLNTAYDIAAIVGVDLDTAYDIMVAVGADLDTAYGVVAVVGAVLEIAYEIEPADGVVGASLNTAYAVHAFVGASLDTSYSVAVPVGADLAISYDVNTSVAATLDTTYGVSAIVGAALDTAYAVAGAVGANLNTAYAVLVVVGASLDTAYAIEEPGEAVGASLDTAYAVYAVVGASLNTAYFVEVLPPTPTANPFNFAQEIMDARRILHDTLAIGATYEDDTMDAPMAVRVRWHTKMLMHGDLLETGYAQTIESSDKIALIPSDTPDITFRKNGTITITDWGPTGPTFLLQERERRTGPLEEIWRVVPQ